MEKDKERFIFNFDDKDLVIIAVTILGIVSLSVLAEPTTILSNIIVGLFGICVGRKV